ncbi:MAG: RDD family protein [Candidatus Thalassarchaeaceae archaeon]|nr:RDD family protein [Candidatus Thalassarchaeaceae archaeon]
MAVGEDSGHWPVPEGTILAPLWKRLSAFMLDVIAFMGVLSIFTKWRILDAFNIDMLFSEKWWVILLNWSIILATAYLYQKYLVSTLGRSLGQRWFGLAVVREDGEPLHRTDCGRRAFAKLRYLLPINIIFFMIDAQHIRRRHTHQSSIDLACASIVVIANSLPPAKRLHLR